MLISVGDSGLQRSGQEELEWEPGVTVRMGFIQIASYVESDVEKSAAEAAAGRVKAVRAVVEEIKVQLDNIVTKDDAIADNGFARLAWDLTIGDVAQQTYLPKLRQDICHGQTVETASDLTRGDRMAPFRGRGWLVSEANILMRRNGKGP